MSGGLKHQSGGPAPPIISVLARRAGCSAVLLRHRWPAGHPS